MGAIVTVQAKYEKTRDPKRMMTHAVLNEAIRTDWDAIRGFLPARTATFMRYDRGATKAVVWDEGGRETKIYLPLNNRWYVPDENPFAIPNGKPSNEDDPKALYLYRHQNRSFSGPLGRGGNFGYAFGLFGYVFYGGRGRDVYADVDWSDDSGVALIGRDAIVGGNNAPIVRDAEQSGATTPKIEIVSSKLILSRSSDGELIIRASKAEIDAAVQLLEQLQQK